MNKAVIIDGLERSKKLLRLTDIPFEQNTMYPPDLVSPKKLSDKFIRISTKKDYDQIHRTALENGDYDLLLGDQSFFQFTIDDVGVIRYAYYQTSREIPSYEEFLYDIGFTEEDIKDLLEKSTELPFSHDYDQVISEAKLSNSVTPIRYDYNEGQYESIVHPTSHLHIGHDNEIRIPINVILTPSAFVAFVIRHIYYPYWKKAMNDESFKELYLSVKNACATVCEESFDLEEKKDLYLV